MNISIWSVSKQDFHQSQHVTISSSDGVKTMVQPCLRQVLQIRGPDGLHFRTHLETVMPIKLKNDRTSIETSRVLIDLGFWGFSFDRLLLDVSLIFGTVLCSRFHVLLCLYFCLFCDNLFCLHLPLPRHKRVSGQSKPLWNYEDWRTCHQLETKSASLMHCLNQNQYGTASGACSNGWLRPSWCKCDVERASNSIVVVNASNLWNVPILPSFQVMQVSTCQANKAHRQACKIGALGNGVVPKRVAIRGIARSGVNRSQQEVNSWSRWWNRNKMSCVQVVTY